MIAGSPSLRERRLLAVDEVHGVGADAPTPIETRTLPSGGGVAPTEVRLLALPVDGGRVLGVGVSVGPLQDARQRLVVVLLVAAPLLLAALGTGGWLTVCAALRPVDVLTREAAEISSLESDRRLPEVPGDDEIARLAQTLDRMLARLRVAFDRERAFVDDASHELRSPIAVLRGELELALGAAGSGPRWNARCAARRRGRDGTAADRLTPAGLGPRRWSGRVPASCYRGVPQAMTKRARRECTMGRVDVAGAAPEGLRSSGPSGIWLRGGDAEDRRRFGAVLGAVAAVHTDVRRVA